jgi:predicted DNA-binding protein (MmcQ/YjbR family)
MNIETLREYALQKEDTTEGFPFGESTLVFKVKEKIFLLASLDASPLQFNLKCDPDKALELREEFPENILPGYHMNKKHWNTVIADGGIKDKLIKEMIDDSYRLVRKK